jgi:hypothetical protein
VAIAAFQVLLVSGFSFQKFFQGQDPGGHALKNAYGIMTELIASKAITHFDDSSLPKPKLLYLKVPPVQANWPNRLILHRLILPNRR